MYISYPWVLTLDDLGLFASQDDSKRVDKYVYFVPFALVILVTCSNKYNMKLIMINHIQDLIR